MKMQTLLSSHGSPSIDLSQATDPVSEIVAGVLKDGHIFFDERQAVLKMPLYYVRLTNDELQTVIFNKVMPDTRIDVRASFITEAIRVLRNFPELQIDLDEKFREHQMFVNLKNGIFSISDGKLISHDEKFVFDYCLDFNYKAGYKLEDASNFKHYVESSVGMDQYECLMRVLGYCVSSLTKGRKAFVFYGIGRTGKSTILNVLEKVIPVGLVSHEPFHQMANERAKAHYQGKRLNISRETSVKVNRFEENFKSLVSCEMVTGSEKFEKAVNFEAKLSFLFAGNTDLEFGHLDDAILDRLVYLIFNRGISHENIDLELEDKLLQERDVIFSMALDSLKRLIADKYDFKMSELGEAHLKRRRLGIHSSVSFVEEKCQIVADGKVPKVALYAAYCEFCERNALKPDGRNVFYDIVRNYSSKIKDARAVDASGNSVQGFKGITLNISPKQDE